MIFTPGDAVSVNQTRNVRNFVEEKVNDQVFPQQINDMAKPRSGFIVNKEEQYGKEE
jgi:hypothetical protein